MHFLCLLKAPVLIPLLTVARGSIYFHHCPHSSLPATKAADGSNSLKHQLEGWALSTGNTQGAEHVFFERHKYSSCSLAVSLAGKRGRMGSWGCTVCLSTLYPAGLSRKHSVLYHNLCAALASRCEQSVYDRAGVKDQVGGLSQRLQEQL